MDTDPAGKGMIMVNDRAIRLSEQILSAYDLHVKRGLGTMGIRDELATIIDNALADDPVKDALLAACKELLQGYNPDWCSKPNCTLCKRHKLTIEKACAAIALAEPTESED